MVSTTMFVQSSTLNSSKVSHPRVDFNSPGLAPNCATHSETNDGLTAGTAMLSLNIADDWNIATKNIVVGGFLCVVILTPSVITESVACFFQAFYPQFPRSFAFC